jgi:hypothetical protein
MGNANSTATQAGSKNNGPKTLKVYHAFSHQEVQYFPGTSPSVLKDLVLGLFDLDPQHLAETRAQVLWQSAEGVPVAFCPDAFPPTLSLTLTVMNADSTRVIGRRVDATTTTPGAATASTLEARLQALRSASPTGAASKSSAWKFDPLSVKGHGRDAALSEDRTLVRSTAYDGAGASSAAVEVKLRSGRHKWRFHMMPLQCCGGIHLVPSSQRTGGDEGMPDMGTWGKQWSNGEPMEEDVIGSNATLECTIDLDGDRVLRVRHVQSDKLVHSKKIPQTREPLSPVIVWKHNSHCMVEGPIAVQESPLLSI